jgi:hypothetical protein
VGELLSRHAAVGPVRRPQGVGRRREGGWAAIEAYTELTNVFVALNPLGKAKA